MLSAPYVFIIPQLYLHILQGREWIHFVYLNDNAAETLFAKYLYLTNVFGIVTLYVKDLSSRVCQKLLQKQLYKIEPSQKYAET